MDDGGLTDLPLARAATLVQQVHRELRARILDGRLAPGDEVPDSVIAKQMGVSRAPVRDACNLLVQSGLLAKAQHHPYRVRSYSSRDIGELQLIRYGYEIAAARRLVRTGAAPAGTREILDRMTDAAERADGRGSGEADLDFHRAFVAATGLPELVRLHEDVMTRFGIVVRNIPMFAVPTQRHRHQEILDALVESQRLGDATPLIGVLTPHLLTVREEVEEVPELRPAPPSAPPQGGSE